MVVAEQVVVWRLNIIEGGPNTHMTAAAVQICLKMLAFAYAVHFKAAY